MRVVKNGKRVQELREEKGLSKQALAEAAGINPDTVARVEREETVWSRTGKKIAGALKINPQSISQAYYTPEEAPRVGETFAELVKNGKF